MKDEDERETGGRGCSWGYEGESRSTRGWDIYEAVLHAEVQFTVAVHSGLAFLARAFTPALSFATSSSSSPLLLTTK